jgi:hypothetical protein
MPIHREADDDALRFSWIILRAPPTIRAHQHMSWKYQIRRLPVINRDKRLVG